MSVLTFAVMDDGDGTGLKMFAVSMLGLGALWFLAWWTQAR